MTQESFLALVLPFKDKLFRLSNRYLNSKDSAKDVVQDVILKLWMNKNELKHYKNVEAYAMTMTKNRSLDMLKAKNASNLQLVHTNFTDNNSSLDKQIEQKEEVNKIYKLITELPEKQRIIIQLRDIEQYSFEKIGKVIGMEQTAIRVNLSRARKAIRQKLIKFNNYGIK